MKKYIRSKIKKLTKKYKTSDPEELTTCLDILLIKRNLGKLAGSYRLINRKKVIFINSNLSECHYKIVLAHELGHAILHPNINCYFIKNKTFLLGSKIEREANLFACELLINDQFLGQYIDKSLDEIAKAEYLPLELLELKLTDF